MIRLVGIVLFLCLANDFYGQFIILLDSKTKEPVSNAHVSNVRTNQVSFSDESGQVELADFQVGDDLFISHNNYFPLTILHAQYLKSTGKIFYLNEKINWIDPVPIVTPSPTTERLIEVPNQVERITIGDLKLSNPQTSADLLMNTGKVHVQKSQQGGGSPVLRGFEANKILLVVDGIRMNNAIYRNGHLQNSITIDPQILEQVDVILGPSSVQFGSDALGGVIHYKTRSLDYTSGEEEVAVNINGRIGSANQERSFHADVQLEGESYGMLTSISKSEFGDLRMGSNRMHGDSAWGLVPFYADFDEGSDLVRANADPEIQKGTGYEQVDFLQKFRFNLKDSVDLGINMQYSTSSNVPRFDRLTEYRDDELRWAEWNYGPQNRFLISTSLQNGNSSRWFDDWNLDLAYQRISEERIQRQLFHTVRETQSEKVDVYSANLDFHKVFDLYSKIFYGLEITHNDVNSTAEDFDIYTRERSQGWTRYPNGGSSMTTTAAYAEYKRVVGHWTAMAGARYNFATLQASFIENDFFELPFSNIDFKSGAGTGSIGATYNDRKNWFGSIVFSSAYRNPNVDDFGKVREKGGFVTVPNDFLKPEFAYGTELSISRLLFNESVKVTASGFYTLLRDAIVTRDYTLNGADSLLIGGEMARIQTNQNAQKAFIYGGYFEVNAQIIPQLSANAVINYTYGQDVSEGAPLSHIPPMYGKAGVEYQVEKFGGEIYALMSAAKTLDRYGLGSTDNIIQALEDGTPEWWTLNFKSFYYVSKTIEAQFGIENILDVHYRTFASGMSAPGRNVYMGLRLNF